MPEHTQVSFCSTDDPCWGMLLLHRGPVDELQGLCTVYMLVVSDGAAVGRPHLHGHELRGACVGIGLPVIPNP